MQEHSHSRRSPEGKHARSERRTRASVSSAQIAADAFLVALVESADDAIVSKNLDGVITSWNAGAERIFGYRADEIVGKSILTLVPPELADKERRILASVRNGQRIEHYETVGVRKDGSRALYFEEIPLEDCFAPPLAHIAVDKPQGVGDMCAMQSDVYSMH